MSMATTTTLQVHHDHVRELLLRLRDEQHAAREEGLTAAEYQRYAELADEVLVRPRMRRNILAFLDYWANKEGHGYLAAMVRDLSTRQVVEFFA
jgi:hypothetical protein